VEARAGSRLYSAGQTARIPDRVFAELARRGVVEDADAAPLAVQERVTKPAISPLRKAVRCLFPRIRF
jgi:hypothetical protein